MAKRLSDEVAAQVVAGIEVLEVPQAVKDSILWDVTPALAPAGRGEFSLVFMVAITLPIPDTEDDYALEAAPLMEVPAPQDAVTTHVKILYSRAQAKADEIQASLRAPQNGHKTSPGGIILGR